MKADFSIRALAVHDQDFLWEMLYQAIYVPEGEPPLPRSILDTPKLARYARQWGQWPGDLGFVALEPASGLPVGAAWLRLFPADEKGYGYVDAQTPELSIAILPAYRGQGLGSLLLEALIGAASEKFGAVSLNVTRGNPAARLYRRLGFVVVAENDVDQTMLKMLGNTAQTGSEKKD